MFEVKAKKRKEKFSMEAEKELQQLRLYNPTHPLDLYVCNASEAVND